MSPHRQAEAGKLVQLMCGIYVDADDDIDHTVRLHAVRIAKYLYPNAYLSAASAVILGPMHDGRLFLTGRRVQRQRIRTLEIIQNKAPDQPSIAQAAVGDDMGSSASMCLLCASASWKPSVLAVSMRPRSTRT